MKLFLRSMFHFGGVGMLLLIGGCSGLLPKPAAQPTFYALEVTKLPTLTVAPDADAPTLLVNPPRAAAGYDSQRMIYVREPLRLAYFARNQWVDTPARMLAPLLVAHIAATNGFSAVISSASGAAADLRLDTEIVLLRHEFGASPSKVRLLLRAYLIDNATREVIVARDVEAVVVSLSDDPAAGVRAANQAVSEALDALSRDVAQATVRWRAARSKP